MKNYRPNRRFVYFASETACILITTIPILAIPRMTELRTYLLILTILLIGLTTFGQNINESIVDFNGNCSEAINPEDPVIPEFSLITYRSTEKSTLLNFEIKANCAQVNKGNLNVQADSLLITETDAKLSEQSIRIEIDSDGNEVEVTTETFISEIAFCDCLVNFYYELSPSLTEIGSLTFHGRTFKISAKE